MRRVSRDVSLRHVHTIFYEHAMISNLANFLETHFKPAHGTLSHSCIHELSDTLDVRQ